MKLVTAREFEREVRFEVCPVDLCPGDSRAEHLATHRPYTWGKDLARGSASLDRVFTIGSTYAIRESGLFTGTAVTTKGTMYSRGTFAVRNVVAADTITLNYTQGFSAG